MSAPRRLLDDPSAPDALRDDLRVAAEAELRYDAERGLLALQVAVATLGQAAPLAEGIRQAGSSAPQASAASQASATGGALGGASVAKLTLVAVATALGLAGTLAWMSGASEPPAVRPAPAQRPVSAAVASDPDPAADPDPDPAADPHPGPDPDPNSAVPSAAEAVTTPAARPHHAAPADPDLALRREIDHLARVRALLERDPKAAYELAQAGNRTLSSMFRQEREGLSVLALDAAGEHARARRLARQFLARHPDSPLHERIAELLAPAAEPQ